MSRANPKKRLKWPPRFECERKSDQFIRSFCTSDVTIRDRGIFCDFHLDMTDLQASGTGITSIGQYVQPRLGSGGRRDDRTIEVNLRGRTSSAVFQNVGGDKQVDLSKLGLSPWTNQLLIKYFLHAFS